MEPLNQGKLNPLKSLAGSDGAGNSQLPDATLRGEQGESTELADRVRQAREAAFYALRTGDVHRLRALFEDGFQCPFTPQTLGEVAKEERPRALTAALEIILESGSKVSTLNDWLSESLLQLLKAEDWDSAERIIETCTLCPKDFMESLEYLLVQLKRSGDSPNEVPLVCELIDYVFDGERADAFDDRIEMYPNLKTTLGEIIGHIVSQGKLEIAKRLIVHLPFSGPGTEIPFRSGYYNGIGVRFTSTLHGLYRVGAPESIANLFPEVPKDVYSGATVTKQMSSFEQVLLDTAALAAVLDPRCARRPRPSIVTVNQQDSQYSTARDSSTEDLPVVLFKFDRTEVLQPEDGEIPHKLFVELMRNNMRHFQDAGISMKQAAHDLAIQSKGMNSIDSLLQEFTDIALLPTLGKALAEEFGADVVRELDPLPLVTLRQELRAYAGRLLFHNRRSSEVYRFNKLWHRPEKSVPIAYLPLHIHGEWSPCIENVDLANGWSLQALTTLEQLRENGRELQHCLGRGGYGQNCLHGRLQVLSLLHDGAAYGTILLAPEDKKTFALPSILKNDEGNYFRISQFVAIGNSAPSMEAQNAVKEFIRMVASGELSLLSASKWGETHASKGLRSQEAISHFEFITGNRLEDGAGSVIKYYQESLKLYNPKVPKAQQTGEPLLLESIDVRSLMDLYQRLVEQRKLFLRRRF